MYWAASWVNTVLDQTQRGLKLFREWPVPRHVKDLRQLLGLDNYFHKYSNSYAGPTKPMSDLLKRTQSGLGMRLK